MVNRWLFCNIKAHLLCYRTGLYLPGSFLSYLTRVKEGTVRNVSYHISEHTGVIDMSHIGQSVPNRNPATQAAEISCIEAPGLNASCQRDRP